MKTIGIWMYKSQRKNAKCVYRCYNVFDGKNAKTNFTIYDIYDALGFIETMHENFPYIKIVGYDNNFTIVKERQKIYAIEVVINHLYAVMRYLNFVEFDVTLSDLHSNSNIRYHINKYYRR